MARSQYFETVERIAISSNGRPGIRLGPVLQGDFQGLEQAEEQESFENFNQKVYYRIKVRIISTTNSVALISHHAIGSGQTIPRSPQPSMSKRPETAMCGASLAEKSWCRWQRLPKLSSK